MAIAVTSSKMSYRIGYFLLTSFFVLSAIIVPDTYFYAKCSVDYYNGEICDNLGTKVMLLLIYISVVSTFHLVQGSDPGYISHPEPIADNDDGTYLEYPHDLADEVPWHDLDMMESKQNMPAQSDEYLEYPHESRDEIVQHTSNMMDKKRKSSLEVKSQSTSMVDSKRNPADESNDYLEYPHECPDEIKWNTSSMIDSNRNSLLRNEVDEEKELLLASHVNPLLGTAPKNSTSRDLGSVAQTYLPGGPEGSLRNTQKANRSINGRNVKQSPKKIAWRRRDNAVRSGSAIPKTDSNGTVDNNNSRYEDYCKYCEMSVPLRSHHCNSCQRCVATFDHHCPVIGTCIGERNHCRFYTFILANFIGVWVLSYIVDSAFTLSNATVKSALAARAAGGLYTAPPAVLEIAYISSAFLSVTWWYILFLLLYQTWLICTSSTGYECLKSGTPSSSGRTLNDDFDTCDSPYGGRHVCENFFSFCCFRDGVFSILRGVPWKPMNWKKPSARPNIEDTEVCDNFCRNKYYSCC